MFDSLPMEEMVLIGICLLGLVMVFSCFRLPKDFHAKDRQRRELKRRLQENERLKAEEEQQMLPPSR